jgi:hypothetical protein
VAASAAEGVDMMKKQPEPVTFTPEMRDEIQGVYDAAVAAGKEMFTYRAREYSVRYTYYLLQHLNNVFGKSRRKT